MKSFFLKRDDTTFLIFFFCKDTQQDSIMKLMEVRLTIGQRISLKNRNLGRPEHLRELLVL